MKIPGLDLLIARFSRLLGLAQTPDVSAPTVTTFEVSRPMDTFDPAADALQRITDGSSRTWNRLAMLFPEEERVNAITKLRWSGHALNIEDIAEFFEGFPGETDLELIAHIAYQFECIDADVEEDRSYARFVVDLLLTLWDSGLPQHRFVVQGSLRKIPFDKIPKAGRLFRDQIAAVLRIHELGNKSASALVPELLVSSDDVGDLLRWVGVITEPRHNYYSRPVYADPDVWRIVMGARIPPIYPTDYYEPYDKAGLDRQKIEFAMTNLAAVLRQKWIRDATTHLIRLAIACPSTIPHLSKLSEERWQVAGSLMEIAEWTRLTPMIVEQFWRLFPQWKKIDAKTRLKYLEGCGLQTLGPALGWYAISVLVECFIPFEKTPNDSWALLDGTLRMIGTEHRIVMANEASARMIVAEKRARRALEKLNAERIALEFDSPQTLDLEPQLYIIYRIGEPVIKKVPDGDLVVSTRFSARSVVETLARRYKNPSAQKVLKG